MESFSATIKQELSEINNLKNKDLVQAELEGYLLTTSSNKFITESEYNINRFAKLLNNVDENNYSIEIQGNKYCIIIKDKTTFKTKYENILRDLKAKITLKEYDNFQNSEQSYKKSIEKIITEDTAKAIARGAFMGAGSVTNPSNVYHLEIVFNKKIYAELLKEILFLYDIKMKQTNRDKDTILYIKDGEKISMFLAFIGANKSVLNFEDTRVIKDIRNNVNRLVNCETANLNKTISSSVRQVEAIKFIKEKNKLDRLSMKEREVAEIRLANPNATLAELGKMLNPTISKSGVNHRMMQILEFAKELEQN